MYRTAAAVPARFLVNLKLIPHPPPTQSPIDPTDYEHLHQRQLALTRSLRQQQEPEAIASKQASYCFPEQVRLINRVDL